MEKSMIEGMQSAELIQAAAAEFKISTRMTCKDPAIGELRWP
jgi:hypothetical protein